MNNGGSPILPCAAFPAGPWGLLRSPILHVSAVGMVYLALALAWIASPRPHGEEVSEVAAVYRYLGRPVEDLPPGLDGFMPGLSAFGHWLPVAQDTPYLGAVELYLEYPFLRWMGLNAFALRIVPVAAGLAVVLASHALIRRYFGRTAALLASALLATHGVWVHLVRQGHRFDEAFTAFFFVSSAFLASRYASAPKRRLGSLMAAALLFGLGLSHKITFLWYLVACVVTSLVFRPRFPKLPSRHGTFALAALGVGSLPVFVNLLVTRWQALRMMAVSVIRPTPKDGVDNLDYAANLGTRVWQLVYLTAKGQIWDPSWFSVCEGRVFSYNYLFMVLFVAACIVLPVVSLRDRSAAWSLPLRVGFCFYGVVLLCSPFTVSVLRPSHLLVFFPFPPFAVAALLALLPGLFPAIRWLRPAVVTLALLCIGSNALLTLQYSLAAVHSDAGRMTAFTPLDAEEHWALRDAGAAKKKEVEALPTPW